MFLPTIPAPRSGLTPGDPAGYNYPSDVDISWGVREQRILPTFQRMELGSLDGRQAPRYHGADGEGGKSVQGTNLPGRRVKNPLRTAFWENYHTRRHAVSRAGERCYRVSLPAGSDQGFAVALDLRGGSLC